MGMDELPPTLESVGCSQRVTRALAGAAVSALAAFVFSTYLSMKLPFSEPLLNTFSCGMIGAFVGFWFPREDWGSGSPC